MSLASKAKAHLGPSGAHRGGRTDFPRLGRAMLVSFIAVVVLFNLRLSERIYVNHLAQLALIGLAIAVWFLRGPHVVIGRQLALIVAVAGFGLFEVLRSLGQPDWIAVIAKIGFILATWAAFHVLDPRGRSLRSYLAVFVVGGVGLGAVTLATADPSDVARGVRLSAEFLGVYGFNTFGFLLAVAIVLAAHLAGASSAKRYVLLWLLTSLVLLAFLLMTNSRGPVIALATGLLVSLAMLFPSRPQRSLGLGATLIGGFFLLSISLPALRGTYAAMREAPDGVPPSQRESGQPTVGTTAVPSPSAVIATTPYLERFDLTQDPTVSGRTVIWAKILSDLSQRPDWFWIGAGFGALDWYLGDVRYNSAHNTYLDVLYDLGLLGLAGFIVLLVALGRRLRSLSQERARLGSAVFGLLLVSMLVDSYWGTSQLGWLQSFLFYTVTVANPSSQSTPVAR